MLDTKLIEKALAITGKTLDYTQDSGDYLGPPLDLFFSIEKFCYYLISKDFLNAYEPYFGIKYKESMRYRVGHAFQEAITAYQDGNEILLVDLLSKI